MFFVANRSYMGKPKKDIDKLQKQNKIETIDNKEMKGILGGREKMNKLKRIIGFFQLPPL